MENKKLRLIITSIVSIGLGICLALLPSPFHKYNHLLVISVGGLFSMIMCNLSLIAEWILGREL